MPQGLAQRHRFTGYYLPASSTQSHFALDRAGVGGRVEGSEGEGECIEMGELHC